MWQNPTPKAKANQAAKKRQRERYRRPLHIKRLEAMLHIIENGVVSQVSGRCVLNDLSPKGIGVLTHEAHAEGTLVQLTIPEPRVMKVQGKSVWCQKNHTSGRIISQDSFPFRMGIQFTFETDEKRVEFENFCDDLFKHYLGFLPPGVAQQIQAQAQADAAAATNAPDDDAPAGEGEAPAAEEPAEGSGEGTGGDGDGNPLV